MSKQRTNAGVAKLGAMVFSVLSLWSLQTFAENYTPPLMPLVLGNPGQVGVGPVIDKIAFEGNRKIKTAELEKIVQLKTGTPLSASVVYPELERITEAYKAQGGAYVQPSILELSLNHAKVIFQIHEGVTPSEGPESAPLPKNMQNFLGNTLVCAAAQTGNDLCKLWLNKDGTFVIFDPNGAYTGKWVAGKTRADGRTPICRFWDLTDFQLPDELRGSGMMAPAPQAAAAAGMTAAPAATAPRSARICETKNFRTICTVYPDVSKLSPELQSKAGRSRVQINHEEGSCYAHGPHAIGDVWFEWDNYSPGQVGLDREILLKGQQ
ncbi:MAG: POTRA domain-containing protein [Steroidobacteraceae bacterium]